MNKIKKRIYFRTLRHPSFLLPPVMECFTEKVAFWDTLLYIYQIVEKENLVYRVDQKRMAGQKNKDCIEAKHYFSNFDG